MTKPTCSVTEHTIVSHCSQRDVTGMNAFGEIPLVGAPLAVLPDGKSAIPQQFFVYQRNREIVENILSHIGFDANYPLFVSEASGHLFLQVGIVGQENYPPNQTARPKKIVYGRKWYIEPTQPTSEIIQTAFLALIKAREHELREFFTLSYAVKGKTQKATPFNSHMDLPLMASHPELFTYHADSYADLDIFKQYLSQLLKRIYLANHALTLASYQPISDSKILVSLVIESNIQSPLAHFFPELTNTTLNILTEPSENVFLFALMDALLKKSQAYVEEHFTFTGFPRFSRHQQVEAIGQFSLSTRLLPEHADSNKQRAFKQLFKEMTEQVDSARAPQIAKQADLHNQQQSSLANDIPVEGYLPR